jgi:hypothetical protein
MTDLPSHEEVMAAIPDVILRKITGTGDSYIDFEVWQEDDLCASANSWPEIQHYAAQYAQDGPLEIYMLVRVRVK